MTSRTRRLDPAPRRHAARRGVRVAAASDRRRRRSPPRRPRQRGPAREPCQRRAVRRAHRRRPRPSSPTQALIESLLARVAADPDDADAQRDLGLALLQRVRETADPSLYAPAEAAFDAARTLAPDDVLVLVGLGGLQLGRHEFADALETGEAAVEACPGLRPGAWRRRRCAGRARPVRRRPTPRPSGCSRCPRTCRRWPACPTSRELRGDLAGALERDARGRRFAGSRTGEHGLRRRRSSATCSSTTATRTAPQSAYEAALALVPDHAPSLAGLGRLAVGRGRPRRGDRAVRAGRRDPAAARVRHRAGRGPRPRRADRRRGAPAFELARAEIQLFQAGGVVVDLDLALFEADHGDPARALELAEAAYAATPTVRAADALAWALHRLGRDDGRQAARRRGPPARLARPAAALPRRRDRGRAG